jgi:hypothetical protein
MRYMLILFAILPAFQALWYARYLIETFFPDVTLIDLGVFYILGFVSGLLVGLFFTFSRRRKGGE